MRCWHTGPKAWVHRVLMCDALSRNLTGPLKTIVANCTAHARRKYVEVAPQFPEECRFVLETLAEVYQNDALCREPRLPPEERLRFHQTHSGPLMKTLENWLAEQFAQRKVEPNSGLGQAITYMRKHWQPLTLHLAQSRRAAGQQPLKCRQRHFTRYADCRIMPRRSSVQVRCPSFMVAGAA